LTELKSLVGAIQRCRALDVNLGRPKAKNKEVISRKTLLGAAGAFLTPVWPFGGWRSPGPHSVSDLRADIILSK
jgi:hypothetical protein